MDRKDFIMDRDAFEWFLSVQSVFNFVALKWCDADRFQAIHSREPMLKKKFLSAKDKVSHTFLEACFDNFKCVRIKLRRHKTSFQLNLFYRIDSKVGRNQPDVPSLLTR